MRLRNPFPSPFSVMRTAFLFVLAGLTAGFAAETPATSSAPAAATPGTPPAAATRPPPDTHGVDMRTQTGPAGPRYSPPVPVDEKLPTLWLIGDSTVRNGSAGDGTNLNQWGWGAPLTFFFD